MSPINVVCRKTGDSNKIELIMEPRFELFWAITVVCFFDSPYNLAQSLNFTSGGNMRTATQNQLVGILSANRCSNL
jgi:hypothetical protein